MKLTKEDVKKYIPHRDPMLFVDRVIDFDLEERTIHAQYDVKEDWDILKGHFPGAPIMPGVLTTEGSAQASAILTNMILGRDANSTLFYFMAIEKIRFRKPIIPPCVIDYKAKMVKNKRSIYKYSAQVFVGDTLVSESEFTAKVIEK